MLAVQINKSPNVSGSIGFSGVSHKRNRRRYGNKAGCSLLPISQLPCHRIITSLAVARLTLARSQGFRRQQIIAVLEVLPLPQLHKN